MRLVFRGLLLAITVSGWGCDTPWQVEEEYALANVPEVYADWFMQVARCMDRPERANMNRFNRIEWYGGSVIYNPAEGRHAWGLWTEPHKITIRDDLIRHERVVKHEIVHDLLDGGDNDDPRFELCSGIGH